MNKTPTPTQPAIGGSGMHPSVAQHLQRQQAQAQTTASSTPVSPTPAAVGGGGYHPAVASHLRAHTALGGGGCHPAVARHLQGG